jgi:hypothetical protein
MEKAELATAFEGTGLGARLASPTKAGGPLLVTVAAEELGAVVVFCSTLLVGDTGFLVASIQG